MNTKEYKIPVAYVAGNVICVSMTEEKLRQSVRDNPIEGVSPDAPFQEFLDGYNVYLREVVLKDYYKDIAK